MTGTEATSPKLRSPLRRSNPGRAHPAPGSGVPVPPSAGAGAGAGDGSFGGDAGECRLEKLETVDILVGLDKLGRDGTDGGEEQEIVGIGLECLDGIDDRIEESDDRVELVIVAGSVDRGERETVRVGSWEG